MKSKILGVSLVFAAFFSFETLAYAAPQVMNYKLNGKEESARLNPSRGDAVNIEINTNVPVKFSRISLCKVVEIVCDDNHDVRYFTKTTDLYISSFIKPWDGKTTDGIAVPDGDYKIKVKMKDETSTEYKYTQELSPYIITIDSSYLGGSGGSSSSFSQNSSGGSQSSGQPFSSSSAGSGVSYFASVYSSSAQSSSALKYSNVFEVGAGNDRLVYTDTPTDFMATVGVPKGFSEQAVKYAWSFGDGSSAEGKKVSHTYRFAGDYIVVLNGSLSDSSSASRANVKVIAPSVFISKTAGDSVEITNAGSYEINLKGWSVSNSLSKFVFSSDTIISPNKKIAVPDEYMKLNLASGGRVFLLNPSGKEASLSSNIAGGRSSSVSLANASSDSNLDNDPVVKQIREFIAKGGKASSVSISSVSKNNLSAQAGKVSSFGGKSSAKSEEASVSKKGEFFSSSTQAAVVASNQTHRRGFIRSFLNLPSAGLSFIKKLFYSGN